MSPAPRSGGQLLADQLALHDVDLAFCVPGESYLALLDGLYAHRDRLRVITCRHEAAAANAGAYGATTVYVNEDPALAAPLPQPRVDALEALVKQTGAENVLSGALGRLMAVIEAYPDLKANQNMMQLSEELTSTENKVSFARQAYNDSVMTYNTAREVFPNNLIANMFAFTPAQLLEIERAEMRAAPKVSFT